MSWMERFRKKREQMKAKLTKAMSSTGSKMKRVMTSTHSFGSSFGVSRMGTLADVDYDWDPEGRTVLSRHVDALFFECHSLNPFLFVKHGMLKFMIRH